jgi:hypothetical protein
MTTESAEMQPRNWWSRNWMWALPVGCMGGLALLAGGGALFVVLIFKVIKSSDAFQQPVAAAKANAAVKAALGDPVDDGWYVSGQINITNDSGNANLQIPLSGPKGDATLYVVGTRAQGTWTYQTMKVVPKNAGPIDLLAVPGAEKSGVEQE